MDDDLQGDLARLAAGLGFDVGFEFATPEEMAAGIREIAALAPGDQLTDLRRRALLQNVSALIRVTCTTRGRSESIRRQSQLPRFRHLRGVMPQAADAYGAVLRYLGIEVPHCLRGDPE
jgi:hypothetical protein